MLAKSRLIKRAPSNGINHFQARALTQKERILGHSFEWLDRVNNYKRIWEAGLLEQRPYEIPKDGVIPALQVFSPMSGQAEIVSSEVVCDFYFFTDRK